MESVTAALAVKAVELLTPYLKKGIEKFSQDVGKKAADKIHGLFNIIKSRFSGDIVATDIITRYEKEPEKYETYAKDVLAEKIAQDNSLAGEIRNRLKELGPTIEIIQKMKIVDGKTTGLEADEVGGKAQIKVSQEIDEVKEKGDVTGAKIKKIG